MSEHNLSNQELPTSAERQPHESIQEPGQGDGSSTAPDQTIEERAKPATTLEPIAQRDDLFKLLSNGFDELKAQMQEAFTEILQEAFTEIVRSSTEDQTKVKPNEGQGSLDEPHNRKTDEAHHLSSDRFDELRTQTQQQVQLLLDQMSKIQEQINTIPEKIASERNRNKTFLEELLDRRLVTILDGKVQQQLKEDLAPLTKEQLEIRNKLEEIASDKGSWQEQAGALDRTLENLQGSFDQITEQELVEIHAQLKTMTEKRSQNSESLQSLRDKLLNSDTQVSERLDKVEKDLGSFSDFQAQLKNLRQRVEKCEPFLQYIERYSNVQPKIQSPLPVGESRFATQEKLQEADSRSQSPQTTSELAPIDWKLAQEYNHNPDSFSEDAVEVAMTEKEMNLIRLNAASKAVFEKSRRGSYWVISEQGFNYLVPARKLKITQHNQPFIQAVFEIHGSQSGSSDNFKLIKPAKVFAVGQDKWQLDERGALEFI